MQLSMLAQDLVQSLTLFAVLELEARSEFVKLLKRKISEVLCVLGIQLLTE